MDIVEIDAGWLDLTPHSVRSSGVHVSEIIRDILNTIVMPGKRAPYEELSPMEQKRLGTYAAGGWAWEQIVRDGLVKAAGASGRGINDRYAAAGEWQRDGIYGSPDWIDLEHYRVVEFKATWRSSRRPLEPDFWHWLVQIRAYCHLVSCRSATLYVLFVNGDYRDSGPQFKGFELDFTELEILENWQMLLNHARYKGWLPKRNSIVGQGLT